ncbi:MAG: PIN domain-containing protein [Actinomycetia bacterium]|nr:PIN domain-containing protein [Actinomycetes bacterium]
MKDLMVESDILIDLLNGVEGARNVLRAAADEGVVLVCAISAAEVMAAAARARREPTGELLESFGIVPVEKEVALLAGEYWSDGGRGNVELGDCIVAAVAEKLGSVLLTKGHRRYPGGEYKVRVVSY